MSDKLIQTVMRVGILYTAFYQEKVVRLFFKITNSFDTRAEI